MANTFVKLSTVTVGAGGAASISFTSIPQTYADLKILVSGRLDYSGGIYGKLKINFNSVTTGYTTRTIYSDGNALASQSTSNTDMSISLATDALTASVFGNMEIYIPNYTSANNKSYSIDAVAETNGTYTPMDLSANLWSNSAAITSIVLSAGSNGGNFKQYSTATLYGIKNT
jgi:hypothetical protein